MSQARRSIAYGAFLLLFYLCGILLPVLCHAEAPGGPEGHPAVMTLSQGLKLATENSRLVKIASRGRDVSSADVSIAFSRYLPSINASLGQTFLSHTRSSASWTA